MAVTHTERARVRWLAAKCNGCGRYTGENRATGKPFWFCRRCRVIQDQGKRARYASRTAHKIRRKLEAS